MEVERHIRTLIPTITVAGALLALTAGVPQAAADAITTSFGTDATPTAQSRPAPPPLDVHIMRHPIPPTPAHHHRHRAQHQRPDIPASIMPALLCIHTREGSWTNPNYGGMGLMTATQQLIAPDMLRKYGTTAQAWSPHDQLLAAYRLYLRYGWEPWPNTSRMCGLA